jgi:hypothetical protein
VVLLLALIKKLDYNLKCFSFNFLTLAGSNCPFLCPFLLHSQTFMELKSTQKGQFEPARVRKLNAKQFNVHVFFTLALASEVAGGLTVPFKNRPTMPF